MTQAARARDPRDDDTLFDDAFLKRLEYLEIVARKSMANPERGEGTFQPTGAIPAVMLELKAQGHRIDETMFRRLAR